MVGAGRFVPADPLTPSQAVPAAQEAACKVLQCTQAGTRFVPGVTPTPAVESSALRAQVRCRAPLPARARQRCRIEDRHCQTSAASA